MENIKVLTIIGPTAIGKSKLGVDLAKLLDGEIISGDSIQVYKELNIGTAKVTKDEMEGVPHYLIDIIDLNDTYSVHDFQKKVRELIKMIHEKGKLPIIVGGTGLYIKAALYDYEFDENPHYLETDKKYQSYSNQELYTYLQSIDETTANILHPNNRRRVLRAIEIFEQTGQKKSDMLSKQKNKPVYDIYMLGLTCDREILYQRINQRVDMMIEEGLLDEIVQLNKQYNINPSMQSMQAIGYKEWFDYLNGSQSFEDTINLIKKNSRNFAKRQMTWFRNQFDVHWYSIDFNNLHPFQQNIISDLLTYGFLEKVIVAGGCFWGVEAYYKKIKGICFTRVGYAQGYTENPIYHDVKKQRTGHAEVVELLYNPSQISLHQILEHLFRMIDPISLNKQGGDIGTSYRTGVYFVNKEQEKVIKDFINKQQNKYEDEIVVEVEKLNVFYDAEEYHQKYLDKNPNGYCHINFNLIKEFEKKV